MAGISMITLSFKPFFIFPLQKLSLCRAGELSVRTLRLPIDEYMVKKNNVKNFHSKILAINQGKRWFFIYRTVWGVFLFFCWLFWQFLSVCSVWHLVDLHWDWQLDTRSAGMVPSGERLRGLASRFSCTSCSSTDSARGLKFFMLSTEVHLKGHYG